MSITSRTPYLLIATLLLSACSTTKNLPEGEQLYVGIDRISYTGEPVKASRNKKATSTDSTGVITAVADAVDAVEQLLAGGSLSAAEEATKSEPTDKEARRALREKERAEAEAFETARSEVEAVLAYPPNNALFGSSSMRSPLPFGLWAYNAFVGKEKGLGKWLFKTFAADPVLVSKVSPEMRSRIAENTLKNYGYFRGRAGYEVITQKNPRKASIAYNVHAGPVWRLDSIAYLNFPPRADSLLRATSYASHLHKGDAFRAVTLSDERSRIEQLFRENGYFYYTAAYTTFSADTLIRPGYVWLRVQPDPTRPANVRRQWYIGRTHISMRRSADDVLDHTLRRRDFVYSYSGEKMPLKASVWRRAMSHRRGELFRLSDSNETLEKLGNTGVFSGMDINYVPRDTTPTCDTLDVYVTTVIDRLFDSSFETNATLKSNGQVGPGVSYSIAKRNAFRGGERVSFKVYGSYEWQTRWNQSSGDRSLLNSYELGTSLSLDFPRLIVPRADRRRRHRPGTTTFSLSADWKNRANFFGIVTFGADMTYKWRRRSTITHEFTPFSLEFDKMIHKTAAFDSIMTANPALYVSMRNQFVPSVSYTMTYQAAATHRNPLWLQFSVKEAGGLTSGLFAAAGKPFSERDKRLFGSPFAQFVKLTAEAHETFRLTSGLSLATRLFAGAIYSYGNADHAPYSEQFSVGGANSIRAFTIRTIGPGSYRAAQSKYAYIDQTGDIKLEANVELRTRLLGSLHGAVFLDAGNVWLMREDPLRPGGKLTGESLKHIAVGTGAGLRYDLEFIVLRLDFGVGLHAPYATSKKGFYNIERFKDGFAFHFAIGYPF